MSEKTVSDLKPIDYGKKIEAILKQTGLNQKEFAESIGSNQPTLSRYLSGERTPSIEFARSLFYIHDINPNWFFSSDETIDEIVSELKDTPLDLQKILLAVTKTLKGL